MELKLMNKKNFEEHIYEFKDLYELCFRLPTSIEDIKWRYLENIHDDLLVCMAFEKGKMIANYSVSPLILTYCGNDIPAVLSLNTMTHPDYFGQGLFVKLAKQIYKTAYEKGYQLVFGFPNKISNRTFITKLDWKDIYEIPMLELSLSEKKTNNTLKITYDNSFDLDYSLHCKNDPVYRVKKSKEYLKWRYHMNPTINYNNIVLQQKDGKVTGYLIFKEYKDRLNLVDYSFCSDDVSNSLLEQLIQIGIYSEKNYISTWVRFDSSFHLLLEKYGFYNTSPVTYFGANWFANHNNDFKGYQYSNWQIYLTDDNAF
ncbi:MAG: GNAT family N-acetyltransferase [Lachnospiraceae bacterium]|nr:GNAT family N-acetyltransferase [Lachnospiraceae bacterium]